MKRKLKIAVLGDFNSENIAHQCIPRAIELAAAENACDFETMWIETADTVAISQRSLACFDGIWASPGSPYKNRKAVLQAIRFARLAGVPFLGTCSGFQHAILEFARNSMGYREADSGEENATASMLIISALPHRLNDERKQITISENSQLSEYFGTAQISEDYECGFGLNPTYVPLFDLTAMNFSAFNAEGLPQTFELAHHRFFIGTAFQPERSARHNKSHPLINAFLRACDRRKSKNSN